MYDENLKDKTGCGEALDEKGVLTNRKIIVVYFKVPVGILVGKKLPLILLGWQPESLKSCRFPGFAISSGAYGSKCPSLSRFAAR